MPEAPPTKKETPDKKKAEKAKVFKARLERKDKLKKDWRWRTFY